MTPLYLACDARQWDIAALLIELGADTNIAATLTDVEWSPLYMAARIGHAPTVKLLVENGARNSLGKNPLMLNTTAKIRHYLVTNHN